MIEEISNTNTKEIKMKNLVKIGIAALAACSIASAAYADVDLSGDAKVGVEYTSKPDANQKKYGFVHDFDVKFNASGDTDRGLSFGASMELGHDGAVSGSKAWIGSDFGTVSFGAVDAGDDYVALSKVGLDGLGVADIVKVNGGSASQFRYDYSQGAFSVALSAGKSTGATMWTVTNHNGVSHSFNMKPTDALYNADFGIKVDATKTVSFIGQETARGLNDLRGFSKDADGMVTKSDGAGGTTEATAEEKYAYERYVMAYDLGPDGVVSDDDMRTGQTDNSSHGEMADTIHYAVGTSLAFGPATVSAGYDSLKTMSVGAGYDFGQGNVNGVYVKHATKGTGYGVDGTFNVNTATSITVNYAKMGMDTGYGLGAKHDLGGGAEFVGGVAKVGDSIKASVGMAFSF